MTERPYELTEYISLLHRQACDGNQCDHKPTYQAELDGITRDCDEQYARGLKLISGISAEDRERCRKLYIEKRGNSSYIDSLAGHRIDGQWVLVPSHIVLIEEMRRLKRILA